MKKQLLPLLILGSIVFSSCSTVNTINSTVLRDNYETKIHKTRFLGRVLFKRDVKKKDVYDNVKVCLNENEVGSNFEVIGYGSYTPLIIPIISPERPKLEKNLLWKAAKKARKMQGDGVIIDSKNDFRVIKTK